MQNITFFPTTLSNGNIMIDKSTLAKLNFRIDEKVICFVNPENELVIKNQKDLCIFCGKTNCLHTICEASICNICREELREYSKR